MSLTLWQKCLIRLQNDLTATEFSMWIRPLHVKFNNHILILYAPNRFIIDWVHDKYLKKINVLLNEFCGSNIPILHFIAGIPKLQQKTIINKQNIFNKINSISDINNSIKSSTSLKSNSNNIVSSNNFTYYSNINHRYNFNNFIEGKSNQLARAIAFQVANNLNNIYNPLFFYGETGLGKTHLLHAIANNMITRQPNLKIIYIHSECFVQNMLKALRNNTIEEFKNYYRSVDALLIDDIQFFANKLRSQEEFFHTFNYLLECNQQIILTSDRYPKYISGFKDSLKSRFECGLIVAIKEPELETRIAILLKISNEKNIYLSNEVTFFLAKNLRSNIRELEGAINRIIANYNFTGSNITIDFVSEVLHDLFSLQEKIITITNIQKTVAKYYKIKIIDLLSKRRLQSITRPRQMAMAIVKKLTKHSLPEIGNAFGLRDHTTVIHACKRIKQLCKENHIIQNDFSNLIRLLYT